MQIVSRETYYVLLDDEGYPRAQGSRKLCETALHNLRLGPMAKPPVAEELNGEFDLRTDQYIKVIDKIAAVEAEMKEKLAPIKQAKELLEQFFMSELDRMQVDSVKARTGVTIYRKTRKSASLADPGAFRDYVKEHDQWDLADIKANAPAVAEFIEKHGVQPPGVNFSQHVSVGYRSGGARGKNEQE